MPRLGHILALLATLLLACASADVHAYARPLQSESAPPKFFAAAETAPSESAPATPSRVEGFCPAPEESTSSLGVTGYQKDELTGLYYAGARFYDPLIGSFDAMDPVHGKPPRPLSFNPYVYAQANPTVYVDKDGREVVAVFGAMAGTAFGTGQAIGGMFTDWRRGTGWRGWAAYGSVVAQNAIGGAELGAAVDAAILTRGSTGGRAVSGALGFAGGGSLTFAGQAESWDEFGYNQLKHGAVGGVFGLTTGAGQGALATYTTVAGRLGASAGLGFSAGVFADATSQSIDLATERRSQYSAPEMLLSGSLGAAAEFLPQGLAELRKEPTYSIGPRDIDRDLDVSIDISAAPRPDMRISGESATFGRPGTAGTQESGKPLVLQDPTPIRQGATAETASSVPSVREGAFGRWFDKQSMEQFEKLWSDPATRRAIQTRLRSPGGLHEWLLVARANVFKRWGVSAETIAQNRTSTGDVGFVNPTGRHGGTGSTTAHNELLDVVDTSLDYEQYLRRLQNWANYRLEGGTEALPSGLQPQAPAK